METVVLQSLSKTYSSGKLAVRQVSLALKQGEVFGFLGPNGAGKTTTVKLLNGMLSPTEGSCQVLGFDPVKEPEKVHRVSGVLTEHAQMYDNRENSSLIIGPYPFRKIYCLCYASISEKTVGFAWTRAVPLFVPTS